MGVSVGGSFQPTQDYEVSGTWRHTGAVVFTGAMTLPAGVALTTPTITSPTLVTPALGVATATSIAATGAVTSSGGDLGFATGAGGTQTQLTSKATTVVLSKRCGAITLAADELGAGTIVSFTLTDTTIKATDVLILNHISGGTVGAYTLNAQAGAGSAVINVRNATAGALSEALVIQFAVIDGVNA